MSDTKSPSDVYDPMLRGSVRDPDPTPPMGITLGDRVILEQRLAIVEAELRLYMDMRRQEVDRFQTGQMMPLERTVDQLHARSWFAIGLGAATLAVCLATLVVVVLLHVR